MKKTPVVKPMTFSYSKLSTYRECPQRYKCRYVDKIPQQPKYYFSFGTAVHAALEFMHSQKKMPTLAEVVEAFTKPWDAKNWQDAGYPSKERYAYARADGAGMLTKYYGINAKSKAFATEYKTDVLIDGLLVRIIADKIELDGLGDIKGICTASLRIIDYKTGKNVVRSPDQLMMYQKVVECDAGMLAILKKKLGKAVKKVQVKETVYLHVPSLEEHPFPRSSPAEIKKFWAGVLKVAADIRAAKFDPAPSEKACKWCDYKMQCPAQKNQGFEL